MEIHISKGGNESGPFDEDQVKSMYRSGMIDGEDLVWHLGLDEWIPARRFLGLKPPLPGLPKATLPSTPPALVRIDPSIGAPQLGGYGARLGAYLVDVILGIIISVPFFILAAAIPAIVAGGDDGQVLGSVLVIVLCIAALFFPRWLYHSLQESSAQQATLGQRVFGLKITDLYGNRVTRKEASRRFISLFVTELVLGGILFIACFFSEKRQCLHDQYAGTLVVKK